VRRGQALVLALQTLAEARRQVHPDRRFVNLFWAASTWKLGDASVVLDLPPHYRKRDLLFLRDLLEAGKYRPVIDRSYPLEDVVEATKSVETEQKTGNAVLTVTS